MYGTTIKRKYCRPKMVIYKMNCPTALLASVSANTASAEELSNGSFGAKGGDILFDDEDDGGDGWGNNSNSLWDE